MDKTRRYCEASQALLSCERITKPSSNKVSYAEYNASSSIPRFERTLRRLARCFQQLVSLGLEESVPLSIPSSNCFPISYPLIAILVTYSRLLKSMCIDITSVSLTTFT